MKREFSIFRIGCYLMIFGIFALIMFFALHGR
jgi:succinate-acetate transporter protein